MRLYTSPGLLYPITVSKLRCKAGDDVEPGTTLFVYEYKSQVTEWDPDNRVDVEVIRSFYTEFESEYEGKINSLDVKAGQVINGRTAVADIEEACRHEIQFGGICADCGKDMTTVQYTTTKRDTERATVNTVHGHTQLLVSQEEASKADEEAKRRLLDSRKLSLVVDLDQTIIQATVDPTVAEWQKDPSNPNYDAVKDVRAFQLVDDAPGVRGCWYYIKLRPGLEKFLEELSKKYEMHIYTMGTRAYAENISKLVDPERKYFGERILSRDESGSMTAKNLKRLFPVDSKMVVIIDDRGDVWNWSPNLIKVTAFDFFVGIGDINSSFLPKRPGVDTKTSKPAKVEKAPSDTSSAGSSDDEKSAGSSPAASTASTAPSTPPSANGEASTVDRMVSMAGKQDAGSIQEQSEEQDEQIANQMADRPLLQKQKILDAAEEEAKTSPAAEAAADLLSEDGSKAEEHHSKYRHNLLQDDDTELEHLGRNLGAVHAAFFDEYGRGSAGSKGGRIAELRPGHSKKRSFDQLQNIPDAAILMANIKAQVLNGVNIVFTGVVPLGVDIETHDTAVWAKSFGATVEQNVSKRTTHVIASPDRRTMKVKQAVKRGRIAIVSQPWLFACFTQWRKVDEKPYRIHTDETNGSTSPTLPDSFDKNELMLSESDEEAARTEDEADTPTGNNTPNGLPSLNTDADLAELEQLSPTGESPVETEKAEDWEGINDELAEFLGSDLDDDSDTETVRSDRSGLKTPPSQRKRKRDVQDEGGTSTDGESSDADAADEGSRLQQRKKKATERSTTLAQMSKVPSSHGSTPAAATSVGDDPGGGTDEGGADGAGEIEEEDDLEAQLAAALDEES